MPSNRYTNTNNGSIESFKSRPLSSYNLSPLSTKYVWYGKWHPLVLHDANSTLVQSYGISLSPLCFQNQTRRYFWQNIISFHKTSRNIYKYLLGHNRQNDITIMLKRDIYIALCQFYVCQSFRHSTNMFTI